MTLTVPRSGTVAGRAPTLQAVPDATGQLVTQLADVMSQVGTRLEDDRLSRERNRLQVEMTRDMNNLRLELEDIGDPDVLEASWNQRRDALRATYMDGQTEDGRPRVDPRNAERFGLAFDELADRNAFAIGTRALGARQSQREATWRAYEQEATVAAATADLETRAILIANGDAQIDELVAANVITPEEAEIRRQGLRGTVAEARAVRQIGDDPDAFLAASQAGVFNDLPAPTIARFEAQAQSQIASRETAAVREAEAAATERARVIGTRLSEIATIAGDGRVAADEARLDDPEWQAHPDYARAEAAVALRGDYADMATMTPDQLDALVTQEEGLAIAHPYQNERLELLRERAEATREGWASDPVAFAAEAGFAVPVLRPFDVGRPEDLVADLQQRGAWAQQAVAQGYTTDLRVLSDAERDQLRASAAVDQDPLQRIDLAIAAFIGLRGWGEDRGAAVFDDPVFVGMATSLVQGEISTSTAAEVFRGQQVLAAETIVMPPARDRNSASFQVLEAFFADIPGGEARQRRVTSSADALYAARIRRTDPTDEFQPALYAQAVHEVLGGTGTFDDRDATGGLQRIGGSLTLLPRGVNGGDLQAALNAIAAPPSLERDAVQEGGTIQEFQVRLDAERMRRITDISESGLPPMGAENPDVTAFWDDFGTYSIRAVGPDRYVLGYSVQAGHFTVVYDTAGNPFTFSARRLLEVGER